MLAAKTKMSDSDPNCCRCCCCSGCGLPAAAAGVSLSGDTWCCKTEKNRDPFVAVVVIVIVVLLVFPSEAMQQDGLSHRSDELEMHWSRKRAPRREEEEREMCERWRESQCFHVCVCVCGQKENGDFGGAGLLRSLCFRAWFVC